MAERLPVSEPTVATAIANLEQLGILREITGRPRNKIFTYSKYLEILSEGTEPTVGLEDAELLDRLADAEWVWGIDPPLGWPVAMAEAVHGYSSRGHWPERPLDGRRPASTSN